MPDRPRHIFSPNFRIEPESPDRTMLAAECFTRTDGVHFCPARTGCYGLHGRNHVLLTMEIGNKGLFVAWTPEGAREAAQILLDMAARAEANLAEDAATQLANLGKGNLP